MMDGWSGGCSFIPVSASHTKLKLAQTLCYSFELTSLNIWKSITVSVTVVGWAGRLGVLVQGGEYNLKDTLDGRNLIKKEFSQDA